MQRPAGPGQAIPTLTKTWHFSAQPRSPLHDEGGNLAGVGPADREPNRRNRTRSSRRVSDATWRGRMGIPRRSGMRRSAWFPARRSRNAGRSKGIQEGRCSLPPDKPTNKRNGNPGAWERPVWWPRRRIALAVHHRPRTLATCKNPAGKPLSNPDADDSNLHRGFHRDGKYQDGKCRHYGGLHWGGHPESTASLKLPSLTGRLAAMGPDLQLQELTDFPGCRRGCVSDARRVTHAPEIARTADANQNPAVTPRLHCATRPSASAPIAYPVSRQYR